MYARPDQGNMTEPLRILLAEDSESDAELIQRELKRGGLDFQSRRVQSEADFRRELDEFQPHLVISDFSMPQFNGPKALAIARESRADIPFIFISGTIGENVAVDMMKAGADDYVMKNNLARLLPALKRELREAEVRRGRRLAEERLKESEAGLHRAQLMAKIAHVITGSDGSFERWSETLPRLIGVESAQMPRSTREWLDLLHPDDRERFRATAIEAARAGTRRDVEYRLRRADGAWSRIRQVIEPLQSQADAEGGARWFSTLQDVTELRVAEEKILRLTRVYAVLSGINALIVRVRDRDELFREACRIAVEAGKFKLAWLGVVDREVGRVKPVAWHGGEQEYFHLMPLALNESDREQYGLAGRAIRERRAMVVEDMTKDPRILLRKEASERGFHSLVVLPLLVSEEAVGVLALYATEVGFFDGEEMKLLLELAGDISFALDHIEKEERIEYLAYYDSLTGLANRTLFLERLAQYVSTASLEQQQLALIIVNIERFKTINDSFGRQAGDALLKQVAGRLLELAKDPNRVARVGADHFAVVVPHLKHEESLIRGLEQGSRCIDGDPYAVTGTELRISTRSGVALFPSDGNDADTLFRNAEAARKKLS